MTRTALARSGWHVFDVFFAHPAAFPCPEELLILWSTNGECVTGLLADRQQYIRYWFENGPEVFTVLGTSYQQFAGAIVGHVLGMQQPSDEQAGTGCVLSPPLP